MPRLPHLRPTNTASVERYTSTHQGGGTFRTPRRDDVPGHGTRLRNEVETAQGEAEVRRDAGEVAFPEDALPLEIIGTPGFRLKLESLDRVREGILLLNVRTIDSVMHATLLIPKAKVPTVLKWFEQYAHESTDKGLPVNNDLVSTIEEIRLATLPAFWADEGTFPAQEESLWWEVWLRDEPGVVERFRHEARRAGLTVGKRTLRFPERVVLIAFGSSGQWADYRSLFAVLTELRRATLVPTDLLDLPIRTQGDLIETVRARLSAPPADAVAVCLLDGGVDRGHPLLEAALAEEHLLVVDPGWSPADLPDGHGTGMAGLALYGCLTDVFRTSGPISLKHRLESVKILPDRGENHPDNYGAITEEAVARAELASPTRQRVLCMAVTAERCPSGLPTAWSAAIDQISAGVQDQHQRLFCVSAGNIRELLTRNDYPARNHVEPIEDPSQAWNALTVGAYTEKTEIVSADFHGLRPIAPAGGLTPTSRTTVAWERSGWPVKPDIVMEGGNTAADGEHGTADLIDDLALLTTRVSATGAQLTTFGETSAATALAARYCALIQAEYPDLWPETVRALMVHSARWTDRMEEEYPHPQRVQRLRCYGWGVPNLEKALASASNAATLIVQDRLQPFNRYPEGVKTQDMHFHRLPWPKDILEGLGEAIVRLRITLSYFVEPSPGRRGWDQKHRYTSHLLRFDVRRPTESDNEFRRRLTRTAWDSPGEKPSRSKGPGWYLGPDLHTNGTLHSDVWSGTGAELAARGIIAVHPVTGWWKERPHLEGWRRSARYALVVTLETDDADVDLYTPIQAMISAELET